MRIASILLAGASALAMVLTPGQGALAADYPVLRGSQVEDAPPEPSSLFGATPTWGGFYAGGTAGYTTGQFDALRQSENLSRTAFNQLTVTDSGVGLLRFGKASNDTTAFGGFIGYNTQFGDAVLGLEGEYQRVNLQTDQSSAISRLFTGLFPTTVLSAPNVEPINTQTTISVSGRSTTKLNDVFLLKARGGYALGNFMPFVSIGLAVGRIETNASIGQTFSTAENYARFNTVTDASGTVSRTTFIGNAALNRPDGAGGATAQQISSGYVPGLALGGGVEALLGENILLRAEYSRIYFSEYKGVNVVIDSARVGAGIKF